MFAAEIKTRKRIFYRGTAAQSFNSRCLQEHGEKKVDDFKDIIIV